MRKITFLLFTCILSACTTPHAKREVKSSLAFRSDRGDVLRTEIKFFPDEKDTTSYKDSTYIGSALHYTWEMKNGKFNGEFTSYGDSGKVLEKMFSDNGVLLEDIDYYYDRKLFPLDDSLSYSIETSDSGRYIEQGLVVDSTKGRTSEWTTFNTVTGEKIMERYIPVNILEGSLKEDTTYDYGFIIIAKPVPIQITEELDGNWRKYNKQGVLLESRIYNHGVRIK